MGGVSIMSVIRFSIQLMIGEAAFLIGRPRRERFVPRLLGALAAYFLCAFGWYSLLMLIPQFSVLVHTAYYVGLFILTMLAIRFCFDLILIELIFVGTGGYATEHIAFALGRIIQYATGLGEEALGTALHTLLFRFLIYVVTAGLVYSVLIRPNRGKGDL